MLSIFYLLSALSATILVVRKVPAQADGTATWIKVLGFAFFGFMAYAGATKGYEALASGEIRLFSRRGLSGRVASSQDFLFWAQLLMCWCATVFGSVIACVSLLAPRKREA